ncbi:ribosomal protein [Candidatus Jettenia caeni]|uniref:Ribosomal protein n=2 Tax=Candidatus Jettenia TaxID=360731 RepID=I3IP78_9BACT|nr:four helix bundle protein [Candidatus Jettenia sp. AMX1]GAB63523.1 ribosomal protein [Candidatus Jettenia caeni]
MGIFAGCDEAEFRIQETEFRSQNIEVKRKECGMERLPAKSFQDLIVWQKAHQFVLAVYGFSNDFPKKELYGLTSQIRRAAISIAANIAEGFKKKTRADKVRFMNISQGSLEECRYYLILTEDLKYGNGLKLMSQLEEVSKLLESYSTSILKSYL